MFCRAQDNSFDITEKTQAVTPSKSDIFSTFVRHGRPYIYHISVRLAT